MGGKTDDVVERAHHRRPHWSGGSKRRRADSQLLREQFLLCSREHGGLKGECLLRQAKMRRPKLGRHLWGWRRLRDGSDSGRVGGERGGELLLRLLLHVFGLRAAASSLNHPRRLFEQFEGHVGARACLRIDVETHETTIVSNGALQSNDR